MDTTDVEPRARWPHTGIQAPYSFTITGFNQLETGRGVAHSAELVHPTLGVVGRIANEGRGGPTTFHTNDRTRFDDRDLEQFLQHSVQDGTPMRTGFPGLEHLLDEIITETETSELVDEMRVKGWFLIRSYLPREAASWGPQRGAPSVYSRIITRRGDRERVVARLAGDPASRLNEGAYWQMFTGQQWVPLLRESPLTPEQTATRLRRIDQLTAETDRPEALVSAVPFDDELFLFGRLTATVTLLGDHVGTVETATWCDCRRRQKIVAFERWAGGSLQESGTVHAARRCRRLVHID
ncbi:hypothetical protein [Umezawaea sp. Da 62-37]|uniref:hypothetical protein n=1 Tax=Umezawaea sp. Da 62-37 TaxID=3075927 RepID=UPI0028F74C20|nr:hypothetical protein [Umezawaea sp. Da 62-37]WNV83093.1 hypothetical protein RM788_33555 [Umezawaea sp. Da 62-37]